jgi:hypothetical protein
MKPITYITISFLVIFHSAVFSQSSGIDAALSKGNAADLGVFFAEKIDVSILGNDASLSSDEAVKHLNNFFTQNPVKGYKRAHLTPASNGRSAYSLGDLLTASGSYRTYIYFDSKQRISEIRIEK